jgi:hypothetical protein
MSGLLALRVSLSAALGVTYNRKGFGNVIAWISFDAAEQLRTRTERRGVRASCGWSNLSYGIL